MKKFTKIIATIGPSTYTPEMLHALHAAGMNAARINLSHGDRSTQGEYIANIRLIDENFPIILDTKGPEIRTGNMMVQTLHASKGETAHLMFGHGRPTDSADDTKIIPVDYPYLDEIPPGTRILFDDGLVESEVIKSERNRLTVRMLNAGPIGTGKKVTIQGYHVRLPFLTDRDKEDILFAIENDIRLIAASFVRSADDILLLKSFLAEHQADMMIIAKIEHQDAVKNLKKILEVADGIMVARGDLGVELPLEEVPGIQEKIIKKCNKAGKPVIVATQMLESMRENSRPTRAEVNDVAHAILQGADAIMLSAETATGEYPVRSVEMMSLIARQYEKKAKGISTSCKQKDKKNRTGIAQYIAKAAFNASTEMDVKAIITPTETGFTPKNVSRFKPQCPILACTKDTKVIQLLHLVRGVFPMLDMDDSLNLKHYNMSYQLIRHFYETGVLSLEDRIIITSGSNLMIKRGTNLLEIYSVGDIIR